MGCSTSSSRYAASGDLTHGKIKVDTGRGGHRTTARKLKQARLKR